MVKLSSMLRLLLAATTVLGADKPTPTPFTIYADIARCQTAMMHLTLELENPSHKGRDIWKVQYEKEPGFGAVSRKCGGLDQFDDVMIQRRQFDVLFRAWLQAREKAGEE
jgi:hypothetical protein